MSTYLDLDDEERLEEMELRADCESCGEEDLKVNEIISCDVCKNDKFICEDCSNDIDIGLTTCKNCKKSACEFCIRKCSTCKQNFCKNCFDDKTKKCNLCLKK